MATYSQCEVMQENVELLVELRRMKQNFQMFDERKHNCIQYQTISLCFHIIKKIIINHHVGF